ncbi:MAG: protein kinase [Bacteroidia bacterium]|nr:protein kinase [Bacteroidia bacterium]
MAKVIKPPYFDTVVNAGERRLLDFLEVSLPADYVLIPNVEIASTNPRNNRTQYWEYDLIVVAPYAIYNIENKDWKGRIEGDDNYWYLNDRQKPNPLKTGRQKTAILSSKLKEKNFAWGSAWIQNMVTLSHENPEPPYISQEAGKVTFQLNRRLVDYITDPYRVGKLKGDISKIQNEIVSFLIGVQSKKSPTDKREVEGYEIIEVINQEPNFSEYLVRKGGIKASVFKRVKEYALQVAGLSSNELSKRELQIKNGVSALENIKTNPFIANVVYRIDEENHLFYETSDLMDEDSLRSYSHNKTFTFDEIINIIKNISAALKAAHNEKVFHRDINPDNIFMRGGFAILANFGKAYFTDHEEQGYTVQATLTEMNASAYHPMEMVAKEASERSDIYSLGVLIYWLFVRKEPISNPFELDKLGGKLTKDRLPSSINPSLPKWLDDLCNKTIVVDENLRFASIDELDKFINQALKVDESKSSTITRTTKAENLNIDSSELKEGDKVDDYIIHKILGKGGYSRVFKVKHTLQDEYYALKLFHESVNASSVIDEYKSLIKLNHPNIVKFIWNGTASTGQFYTLTEFLDGENLGTYTRTDARLPISRVYQVGKDILDALVALQSQSRPILHRDIKPQNIIWDSNKRFVLIDFNVASFAEDNKDFVGTNPYLAPDLIADNYKVNWDKSADTFALGITLYELVCKQYPWSPSRMPLMSKSPAKPIDVEPRLSTEFSEFLLKAISTSGDSRFKDANEMLAALEKIGVENILSASDTKIRESTITVNANEDIVSYVNSLYSQSKNGNSGTRANFNINKFDELTYTPTKLDKKLIPAIFDGQYKLLIITGNAGDGKTAFIRKIEDDKRVRDIKRFDHKNGAKFKISNISFESNYDGSQDEEERANNTVLEEFFKPFENIANYDDAKEGRIIAINEGRLVEFLGTSEKYKNLSRAIEEYFYKEGHSNLPDGLMIINLNLRSVVGTDQDEPSLFRKQIKAITNKKLWEKCSTCPIAESCFIKYNVDSFNDSAAGENIITRLEWLLRTVSLKRELHITMRDLRSFISFILTRDFNCNEVKTLIEKQDFFDEDYWQYFYFNITNPVLNDNGNQDRLIKLLRETDIGEVSIPDLDRDLFFGKHDEKNYLEFAERTFSLLQSFNLNKIWVPAHEQSQEIITRIKSIQKTFIRHQYFEGRSVLINLLGKKQSDTGDASDLKPSFLLRLPYHSVSKFVDILEKGDTGNDTIQSISRAISLNEGCDNIKIDRQYLVLSSSEIKDPFSKSFRLFSLKDFELFVNTTNHLIKYLEYESDNLVFRHKTERHIQLTVSLDLYEMLYFIQQGFSPSLNDLRGKFVELIIFKNLLENLRYDEVIVTNDNVEFFKISKTEESKLIVQPMIM